MTQTTDQERAQALQDWIPFSARLTLARKHGMTVTKEFNALVRDVIQEFASRRAQVVPDGWKLVPVEPTEGMLKAAWERGIREEAPDPYYAYKAMLAAAPQPPESAQLDDINVADMAQAVDSKEAAPVQMPEPVAVAFRFETEEYGSTAISFYPSDRIGMGWTALYTEHQYRQLLARHGMQEQST